MTDAGECPACQLPETIAGDVPQSVQKLNPLPAKNLGPYEMIEEIGRGGMGVVYKARDTNLDRISAVKVLPLGPFSHPEAESRFRREMQAVARLAHPNIVSAYFAGEQDGVHFLAMEFIDGDDLATAVARDGPFPIEEAVAVMLQILEGIRAAHQAGILHRDIKPSNLLRNPDGQVKILDMGLARIEGPDATLTQSGEALGTPDYMAPELLTGLTEASAQSDIYALGCTFFTLLTGKPLFKGSTVFQKLQAHQSQKAPSVEAACAQPVGEYLESVYQKMVAKDPADRYGSVDEVIDAFEKWTSDPGKQLSTSRKRIPMVLMSVIVLTGVVAALYFLLPNRFARQHFIDPDLYGLSVNTDDWKLTGVTGLDIHPRGIRFHPTSGAIYVSAEAEQGRNGRRVPGGIFELQPDGSRRPVFRGEAFEFEFIPDSDLIFFHDGYRGKITSFSESTGKIASSEDMTSGDDDPTSPRIAPPHYKGPDIAGAGNYLFGDFGNRGPGGIWKFGAGLPVPEPVYQKPARSRDTKLPVKSLDYGFENIYLLVGLPDIKSTAIHRFDGANLEEIVLDQDLPQCSGLIFDWVTGHLLVSEMDGGNVFEVVLRDPEKPGQPARVSVLMSGFEKLGFGGMDLSDDGGQLLIIAPGNDTLYHFDRVK